MCVCVCVSVYKRERLYMKSVNDYLRNIIPLRDIIIYARNCTSRHCNYKMLLKLLT